MVLRMINCTETKAYGWMSLNGGGDFDFELLELLLLFESDAWCDKGNGGCEGGGCVKGMIESPASFVLRFLSSIPGLVVFVVSFLVSDRALRSVSAASGSWFAEESCWFITVFVGS
jgi:hypothetical protein